MLHQDCGSHERLGQCGLWTVPVLSPTFKVGLSVMQVLVVVKTYLWSLLKMNHVSFLVVCPMATHTYFLKPAG